MVRRWRWGATALILVLLGRAAWLLYSPRQPRDAEAAARWMSLVDADGSGALEPAEFERLAQPGARFIRYDIDDSGEISEAELELALEWIDPAWLY